MIETASDGVRLAIDAPKQISILREELSHAEEENRKAIAPGTDAVLSLQNKLLKVAHIQANDNSSNKD